LEENETEADEALDRWYEKNFEALSLTLELELKINERDLQ
jgi:hypothetical protein